MLVICQDTRDSELKIQSPCYHLFDIVYLVEVLPGDYSEIKVTIIISSQV